MNNNTPAFDDILEGITDETVQKVSAAAASKPRKTIGRPKKPERIKKERAAAEKEFIDNFEPTLDYRPEPQRLVKALARPPEEHLSALEAALLPRQVAFCREYVLDYNQRAAAIRAGYSQKAADTIAHNLMTYKGIRRLIDLYTQSSAQKITIVDPDWIIQKITEIITSSAKDGDKLRGLELLARHKGMFIERTEISGRDGDAIKFEETKSKADEVARRLRAMGKKAALSVVN